MSDTAVQRFYRYHAYVYDGTRWMILHGRRQAVERLELQPDSHVLEVGCGTGLNFRFMVDRLDPGRGRLVGLDFSGDMLRQAEKRIDRAGWRHVELLQDDASTMRLDRRFDAIFFAYSLTMIPDWSAAIERARAHLKPGGRLVVLDFSRFHAWGPLAPVMRTWLRLNHVETLPRYEDTLTAALPDTQVHYALGGYYFTTVGRSPAE